MLQYDYHASSPWIETLHFWDVTLESLFVLDFKPWNQCKRTKINCFKGKKKGKHILVGFSLLLHNLQMKMKHKLIFCTPCSLHLMKKDTVLYNWLSETRDGKCVTWELIVILPIPAFFMRKEASWAELHETIVLLVYPHPKKLQLRKWYLKLLLCGRRS